MDEVKPDKEIEKYWEELKKDFDKISEAIKDNQSIIKIQKWSNILNELQRQSRYQDIEQIIEYIQKKMFMIVMKRNNLLLFGYLYTHLERWNKTHMVGKEKEHAAHRIFKYNEHMYVEVLVKVMRVLYNKYAKNKDLINGIFENINDKIKLNKDHNKIMVDIVQKLVDNNKDGCLNIVFEFVDKANIIKNIYGIEVTNGRGGKNTATPGSRFIIDLIKKKEKEQFD